MIVKHKAVQIADQEGRAAAETITEGCPVYFISLVGIAGTSNAKCLEMPNAKLNVEEEEGLFDLYTKFYDFHKEGTSDQVVIVKTARDIQDWFYSVNSELEKGQSKDVSIYTMVQSFIKAHSNGHFFIDECPFLTVKKGI